MKRKLTGLMLATVLAASSSTAVFAEFDGTEDATPTLSSETTDLPGTPDAAAISEVPPAVVDRVLHDTITDNEANPPTEAAVEPAPDNDANTSKIPRTNRIRRAKTADTTKKAAENNPTATTTEDNRTAITGDEALGTHLSQILTDYGVTNQEGQAKLGAEAYIIQDGDDLWIVSGKFRAKLEVLIYSNSSESTEMADGEVVYTNEPTAIPVLGVE